MTLAQHGHVRNRHVTLDQLGQACNLHITFTYVRAVNIKKNTKILHVCSRKLIITNNEIENIVACTRPVIMMWPMTT